MFPSGASEPTVVYKEPLFVVEHWLLTNVFSREAPIEKNIASECVRTVATCMVIKCYNCAKTIWTCTDTMQTGNDTPRIRRIPVHAA